MAKSFMSRIVRFMSRNLRKIKVLLLIVSISNLILVWCVWCKNIVSFREVRNNAENSKVIENADNKLNDVMLDSVPFAASTTSATTTMGIILVKNV